MRPSLILIPIVLLLSSVPAAAEIVDVSDDVGDEVAEVPLLGLGWPSDVIDCDDPSVDITTVHSDSNAYWGYFQAWMGVAWLEGPRECAEQTHARRNEYRVHYDAQDSLLPTQDSFELRATRTPDGAWRSCAVILFADGTESNCFGSNGAIGWYFAPAGNAPYGEWNGYRAYDLRGTTYDVRAEAWSTIEGEPNAFTIRDVTNASQISVS